MKTAPEIGFVVKICGVTLEEDAQAAVDAGANALGFNFYSRSPRYVPVSRAREIAGAVEGEYLRVGVFVNASQAEIAHAIESVSLDVVQLHGDACARPPARIRVWRSIAPNDPLVEEVVPVEAYLLDTPSESFGGSGRTFNWSLAANFAGRAILAGGLDAENVSRAIAIVRPWGVDACSRLESEPGRKDKARLRNFVHAALAGARAASAAETIL